MTTIHDTYINALLADATYVDDLQRGMTGVALRDKLAGRMTSEQAAYIGDNFSVVAQVSGLNSSFEATIWKDKSGQVYVSMRGTQGVPDFAADGDLGTSGLAHQQLADVNLAQDTFHSQFTDSIPLKSGITSLPEMKGSDQVRDLWQAASIGSTARSTLQQKLTAYTAATTRAQQQSLLDDLVAAWGATSSMTTSVGVNLTKAHVGGSPTVVTKGKKTTTTYDYGSTDTAIQHFSAANDRAFGVWRVA
jgi:hypothetical protein